jgi:hypothetical protein
MRIKYIDPRLNNEKGEPKYVCPACKQTGLLLDASDASTKGFSQMCRICGYHFLPVIPGREYPYPDADRKWGEAWNDCGAEVLFDKAPEERPDYYTKLQYAFIGKTYYIPTDEECANRTFDMEKLFSQYGLMHKSDSSRKITVKCEDGRYWGFPYETNKLYCLDDPVKYFAVAEEEAQPGSDHMPWTFLCVGEFLSKKSPSGKKYRGFYQGIEPEAFAGVFAFDEERVLIGLDEKKYIFNIEQ